MFLSPNIRVPKFKTLNKFRIPNISRMIPCENFNLDHSLLFGPVMRRIGMDDWGTNYHRGPVGSIPNARKQFFLDTPSSFCHTHHEKKQIISEYS